MNDKLPVPITLDTLASMKQRGEKIACLTAYDASFTRLLEACGVDMFIIGDSLGMVLMGYESTVPVTMDDMVHHAANVARVGQRCYRVVDLPAHSYDDPVTALKNARRLVDEGGAHMVKLEGGIAQAGTVQAIVDYGIPVCGHVGLLPQSIEELGGYKVQGHGAEAAREILADAQALEAAGAGLLVMECIPASLGAEITAMVDIPTIGIGAGADCDGQVLVLYDILGLTQGRLPRFVKNFLADNGSISAAITAYVAAVRDGSYPAAEHTY